MAKILAPVTPSRNSRAGGQRCCEQRDGRAVVGDEERERNVGRQLGVGDATKQQHGDREGEHERRQAFDSV
ncbi:MAG: hypothetical protein U5O39_04730 [Gammaproteobacteria bacterium]|nr:hypothetical protein [Gammaproteobacteria bacterium]